MKKIITLLLSVAIILSFSFSAINVSSATADPFDGFYKISMTPGATNESMNFSWLVDSDQIVGVLQVVKTSEFREDGEFPVDKATSTSVGASDYHGTGYNLCKATINGLEPNTEYAYRYGDAEKWSNIYNFTTSSFDEFTAIYISDPQLGVTPTGENSDDIGYLNTISNAFKKAPNAALVISAGDQDNSESTLERQIRNYSVFLSPEEFASIPVATVPGNHENRPKYLPLYSRFNNPNSTSYGKMMGGSNYYYEFGNTLFINLNCGTEFEQTSSNDHINTIKDAVKAFPDTRWRILVMHFNIYGTGKNHAGTAYIKTMREELEPTINEYKIDAILAGHEHIHSRSHFMKNQEIQRVWQDDAGRFQNPDGTIYITANSASGNKFYASIDPKPYYMNKIVQENRAQYNIIEFKENELIFNSYFSDTNELADSFTIIKSQNLADLRNLITECEAYNPKKLNSHSAKALVEAIDEAKAVLTDGTADESNYESALNELNSVKDAFERERQTDLYASAVNVSTANPSDGEDVYLSAVIRNTGTEAIGAGVPIDFYVDGKLLETVLTKQQIDSGRFVSVSAALPYNCIFGSHTISVKINNDKSFEEMNTDNNSFKKRFVVLD